MSQGLVNWSRISQLVKSLSLIVGSGGGSSGQLHATTPTNASTVADTSLPVDLEQVLEVVNLLLELLASEMGKGWSLPVCVFGIGIGIGF